MQKKFKAPLLGKHGSVWGQHIITPISVSSFFLDKKVKRIIATINDKESYHCALISNGNGNYFININKEITTKLRVNIGDELLITLKRDDSKYGMPMPEEMKELLYIDPEADALFHKLTAGKQRSLLYVIAKPKTSDTRLKKALIITEYLKSVNGKLDFKELHEAFRQ